MTKQPTDFIYQPINFNPEDYPGPIAEHPDAARWLLNTIHFKRVIRNYGPDEFVNLHSILLGRVMGDINYVRCMRESMERQGLIETDHQWILDRKSLGYRLGPKLLDTKWQRYHSSNKRFLKRIEKFKAWVKQPTGFTHPVHHHLASWAKRTTLPEDLEEAFTQIRALGPCDEQQGYSKEDLARHQAELIYRGNIHTSVCPYGRFHSNFSGLCRELRSYLSVDGDRLAEIDIVNSQPYFLSLLLLEIAVSSHNCPNLTRLLFDTAEDHSLFLSSLSSKQEKKSREEEEERREEQQLPYVSGLDCISEDLRQFIHKTVKGEFYEAFMGEDRRTRDALKPKVFQILYGHTGVMLNADLTETFRDRFPTVFEMLLKLKSEKGYKWVGTELQRRESSVVIKGVCNRLRIDHPEVPVVTIHDSLMTTKDHVELVQDLLRQEFRRFPMSPQFRIKAG